jgi:hypothetical protein
MIRRVTTSMLVCLLFAVSLSGCFAATGSGHRRGHVRRTRVCRSNHNWNGHTCRPRAKSHGLRRHENRPW